MTELQNLDKTDSVAEERIPDSSQSLAEFTKQDYKLPDSALQNAKTDSLPGLTLVTAEVGGSRRSRTGVPRPFEIVLNKHSADLIYALLRDGNISETDSKTISDQIRDAYKGDRLLGLNHLLNARLHETNSGWRVNVDARSVEKEGALTANFLHKNGNFTQLTIKVDDKK